MLAISNSCLSYGIYYLCERSTGLLTNDLVMQVDRIREFIHAFNPIGSIDERQAAPHGQKLLQVRIHVRACVFTFYWNIG